MTEKKKLPERRVVRNHNYWTTTEKDPSVSGSVGGGRDDLRATNRAQQHHRLEQHQYQEGRQWQSESVGKPLNLRRVVTVPPSDPSYAGNAFVERQRRRRERAQSRTGSDGQTQYVARTLAQTGVRAPSGRLPAAHRPLPPLQSPIPTRSGRQKPRRNRLLRFLFFLIVVVIVGVLVDFLLTGSIFRITQVRVVGTPNDALVQRIQNMGMQGQNIFLLDLSSFTSKIESQPEVDTADLSKQWPDQVVVSIKERVPVLLWQTTKALFNVDNQGMVIAPVGNATGGVVIDTSQHSQDENTRKSASALRPGVWINESDVAFAVTVLNQLPQITGEPASSYKLYYNGTIYSSTTRTSDEEADSSGLYTLENVVDGWKAYLGSAGDSNSVSNRLQELHAILVLVQQQQLKVVTIDLRYGLRPVFTLQ